MVAEEIFVRCTEEHFPLLLGREVRLFLSAEMQLKIAAFLRNYKNHQADVQSGFEAARKKQIAEKQAAYDNLMKNMMFGVLAPEVIKEINDRMTAIKGEIETLENAEPPKDYTMETILEWLDPIKKRRISGRWSF